MLTKSTFFCCKKSGLRLEHSILFPLSHSEVDLHTTFQIFICNKLCIFLSLHYYALLSVGLSHNIPVQYIYIWGNDTNWVLILQSSKGINTVKALYIYLLYLIKHFVLHFSKQSTLDVSSKLLSNRVCFLPQVRYHQDFEKSKGSFTPTTSDPVTERVKRNMQDLSDINYRGIQRRVVEMERRRTVDHDQETIAGKAPSH